jgi:hypothetical protein
MTVTATAIPATPTLAIPTVTATIAPSPTFTPTPYPTKAVLLDYNTGGDHTLFDMVHKDFSFSKLVLYADGQMIIPGKNYLQKMLSKAEINHLMTRLDELGFYRIESNQQQDETDRLYNFGGQYSRVYDSTWNCVLVNGERPRNLCADDVYSRFLVPEMKNIMKFLDDYPTDGMTPYVPDRMMLWVDYGRSSQFTDLPSETIPWPDSLPSLETASYYYLYISGDAAREVYSIFKKHGWLLVFSDHGYEFTVTGEIILPHEELAWPVK